jgi:SAM-dependent methyltransferase
MTEAGTGAYGIPQKMPPPDPEPFFNDIAGQPMGWLWDLCSHNDAQFLKASALLQELIAMEATWTDTEPERDEWRYRPYPLGKFGRLLWLAVQEWDKTHSVNADFLEIGCGPGTKVVFVNVVFRLDADGFDIVPKYIEAAKQLAEARDADVGLTVLDAMSADYSETAIIFNNRPFRDLDLQAKLDQKIYAEMSTGSLLMMGNQVTQPPGWRQVAQDVACTLWIKTCQCEGAEDILTAEDEAYLVCRVCGRDFSVGPDLE